MGDPAARATPRISVVIPTRHRRRARCSLSGFHGRHTRRDRAAGRAEYGTQAFDQNLADLVISGRVSFEVALTLATNSLDFELQLRGLRR